MVNDMYGSSPPPFWVVCLILTALAAVGILGIWKGIEVAAWVWRHLSISIA